MNLNTYVDYLCLLFSVSIFYDYVKSLAHDEKIKILESLGVIIIVGVLTTCLYGIFQIIIGLLLSMVKVLNFTITDSFSDERINKTELICYSVVTLNLFLFINEKYKVLKADRMNKLMQKHKNKSN